MEVLKWPKGPDNLPSSSPTGHSTIASNIWHLSSHATTENGQPGNVWKIAIAWRLILKLFLAILSHGSVFGDPQLWPKFRDTVAQVNNKTLSVVNGPVCSTVQITVHYRMSLNFLQLVHYSGNVLIKEKKSDQHKITNKKWAKSHQLISMTILKTNFSSQGCWC